MFLTDNLATQVGTFALVPQVVDAVKVPVIAAGSIADAGGIVAAFALGASGVQLGTAYLHCPESKITPLHRAALRNSRDDATAVTNLHTGRPARGLINRLIREVGPISDIAPDFPLAGGAVAPLRAKAEAQGSTDFSPMWAGEAAAQAYSSPIPFSAKFLFCILILRPVVMLSTEPEPRYAFPRIVRPGFYHRAYGEGGPS